MFNINMNGGGTNSGWRRIKPSPTRNWICSSCGRDNEKYYSTCPSCKTHFQSKG